MEYWYPAQERVVRLAAELRGYEQTTAALIADIDACIPHISAALSKAARTRGFPKRQIPQWVWIASQLRLQAGEGGPAALQAGAALTFLEKKLGALLSPSDVQELNWVLESTVQQLSALLEPEALRSCLSPEELDRIEDRLASYSNDLPFDVGALRAAVGRQMGELSALSTGGHLRTLDQRSRRFSSPPSVPVTEGPLARLFAIWRTSRMSSATPMAFSACSTTSTSSNGLMR